MSDIKKDLEDLNLKAAAINPIKDSSNSEIYNFLSKVSSKELRILQEFVKEAGRPNPDDEGCPSFVCPAMKPGYLIIWTE